jgi:hypothetical protein
MNSKLKVAAVVVVGTVAAFASSMVLWPPPAFFTPPPSLLPFFIGLGIFESLAFGLGLAFVIFGRRMVRETGVGPLAAWGGYLGISWSLVNWWAHDGFHRVTGLNFDGLLRIEYGFHVTLILSAALAAYFFLSVARVASRSAGRVTAAQRASADLARVGANS